ncbi:MAG: thiamine pyrophosphate-binding protein [Deltaproteobacteria bacterium]|nr:MAG: thiamine pyrophosphate-binding protein [Deltaproteobacteria bacterium]
MADPDKTEPPSPEDDAPRATDAGDAPRHAGDEIARVLQAHDVPALYTLCGGHISPILHGAKRAGIRVVDTRHEAAAVFAADATARLTGTVGVAAVTAGPGVTNAVTPLENARLAQSPLLLFGGAAATVLAGRGALQDIDHVAAVRPHVKWAGRVARVAELVPTVRRAMAEAKRGTPGPVFLEVPVDLLYPPDVVRSWYLEQVKGRSVGARALELYLRGHLKLMFAGFDRTPDPSPLPVVPLEADRGDVRRAAAYLAKARRPVVLVGSPAVADPAAIADVCTALRALGAPVYLSGMARGTLGAEDPLLMRHGRSKTLREADCVVLVGVPCDFRLGYGASIPRRTPVVSIHWDRKALFLNRRPTVPIHADPARTFVAVVEELPAVAERFAPFVAAVRARDEARERELDEIAASDPPDGLHPVAVFRAMDRHLDATSTLVADGGDFVGTASYVLRPRGPLRWLDPGVFGTLGVGGGFALGAKLARAGDTVWTVYGDGSVGYSLAEFDTYVRHGVGVIAVVGNDACWSQIAREQVEILRDPVGTELRHTHYHEVAAAFGGEGIRVERREELDGAFERALEAARAGRPALVDVRIARTDFRKGSLSI